MKTAIAACFFFISSTAAQGVLPQLVEHFDSVLTPALPHGWTTSTNRLMSGDFVTTTSSPRSAPNAVISTNATISQWIVSPALDFSGRAPGRLEFYSSRSSSHTTGLLIEASVDDGSTFPLTLSDTLRNPGVTSYVLTSLPLSSSLENQPRVRIRWRLVGSSAGGPSGTFRIDDVSLTTMPACDLALTGLLFLAILPDQPPSADQGGRLKATVKNVGTRPALGCSVTFYRDWNGDSRGEGGEQFAVVAGLDILPSDSTIVEAATPPLTAGDQRFMAVLFHPEDANPANDTASLVVTAGAEARTLVVNEIMYEPLAGQNEWIELYHRGATAVDIARWKFSDRPTSSGTNSFAIASSSLVIQPDDFVVVAADSTIFSRFAFLASPSPGVHIVILNRAGGFGLNNDGDDVILRDALGRAIDSVSYSSSWHHPDVTDTKGRSLERINPEMDSNDRRNWSTSPASAGGTPGQSNGIYTTILPSNASISITPNPFSPDGDGFEDFCVVRYNLPLATSLIRISIFDIRGRLLRRLANGELSGPKGEIVWDGLDDFRQRVRIGPYVVFIESIDGQGGTLATARAVVVVARKL